MKSNTLNKRFHYSYLDNKKGILNGWIDVDVHVDDEDLSCWKLQKLVKRKWDAENYKTGFIDTLQIDSVQS